jgi:hypothetical protein
MTQFRGTFGIMCKELKLSLYRSTEYIQDTKQDNKLHQPAYM